MPAYFLYARKSTDEEDRQVLSLESQLCELKQLARHEGLAVVEEFVEAKTAKEPGRPVFNLMMEQIEQGKAQGVLAWHPDRLARNSVDGGRIIYLLDTGKLLALKFPTYRYDNTAQGKFMLSIAFGQSKYYVDNLAENVRRGFRAKLRRGEWPCAAPMGYVHDYKNHTVAPDPEKAVLVRKIFEVYASGEYSLQEILREALRWGLTGRTGKPVHKSAVADTLRNPFYYGTMLFKGELYEGSHPPLISKKLFDRVQQVLAQQRRSHKRGRVKFTFVGFMRCAECGSMITAEIQKKRLVYYRCTRKKGPCSQKFLREEALLDQVKWAILRVAISVETKEKILAQWESQAKEASSASISRSRRIADQLKACDEKMERLLDLYIARQIDPEEYQRKKAKLLGEKQDLKEALGEIERTGGGWLEPAKEFLTVCAEAGSVAGQENPAALRKFLKSAGSNFRLNDRTLLFSYSSPFDLVSQTDPDKEERAWADSNGRHPP